MPWRNFSQQYGRLAHQGIGSRNLVKDYLGIVQRNIANVDQRGLMQRLLAERTAHPFDSHPPLAQRAVALGVDAEEEATRSFSGLLPIGTEVCVSPEEEVTAIEMEFARRPGASLTISDQELFTRPPVPSQPAGRADPTGHA